MIIKFTPAYVSLKAREWTTTKVFVLCCCAAAFMRQAEHATFRPGSKIIIKRQRPAGGPNFFCLFFFPE
jgi:hypothetical protein